MSTENVPTATDEQPAEPTQEQPAEQPQPEQPAEQPEQSTTV